jgi:hypothetical protein
MGCPLDTFAAWLRKDMSLSDDSEILIDRAAILTDRKRRPTTRWDHLAKQQSFSMPKVPSRRRLGDTIEEDTATGTNEATDTIARILKQSSFCLPRVRTGRRLGGDDFEGAARPGMGVKQASLSSLPRQASFSSLTQDEQMKMPRLVKQSSSSFKRECCEDDQSDQLSGIRPCMDKQDSFSLPKSHIRPRRRLSGGQKPSRRLKLPVRADDSDETTDTLTSMPRLVKQTSFTVARHSSREPLIGDDEPAGKTETFADRRRLMAKQSSFSSPRHPTRTFDGEGELAVKTGSMRKLVKQTSSRGPFIDEDEPAEKTDTFADRRRRMAKQKSFTMPRCPIRTCDSEDEPAANNDTLSSTPQLVKQTSFTLPRHSSRRLTTIRQGYQEGGTKGSEAGAPLVTQSAH